MTFMELLPLCFRRTFSYKKISSHRQVVDNFAATHRFQIAMDDVFLLKQPQALEQGVGESSDQAQAESLIAVLLYQLVQVQAGNGQSEAKVTSMFRNVPHQFEANAEMISEVEVVEHVDDVVSPVFVPLAEMIEYPDLDEGLVVEAFLVSDYFYSDMLIGFVVQSADDLAETTFAYHLEDFVTI